MNNENGIESDRDATIKAIKAALQRRSGKSWSVTGGRGTAWGWIQISAPPARCTIRHRLKEGAADWPENYEAYDSGERGGSMTPADREELGRLLGLGRPSYDNGESIASSYEYYREYLDRAEGKAPSVIAQPYWD